MAKGLYGDDVAAFDRKRNAEDNAHPAPPGTGPNGETCGTCKHIRRAGTGSGKRFRKCWLMRRFWTHSYGTDIRCKDEACKWWENA